MYPIVYALMLLTTMAEDLPTTKEAMSQYLIEYTVEHQLHGGLYPRCSDIVPDGMALLQEIEQGGAQVMAGYRVAYELRVLTWGYFMALFMEEFQGTLSDLQAMQQACAQRLFEVTGRHDDKG